MACEDLPWITYGLAFVYSRRFAPHKTGRINFERSGYYLPVGDGAITFLRFWNSSRCEMSLLR